MQWLEPPARPRWSLGAQQWPQPSLELCRRPRPVAQRPTDSSRAIRPRRTTPRRGQPARGGRSRRCQGRVRRRAHRRGRTAAQSHGASPTTSQCCGWNGSADEHRAETPTAVGVDGAGLAEPGARRHGVVVLGGADRRGTAKPIPTGVRAVGRRHSAVAGRGIPAAAALRDRETAIRGCLIAADPVLAPYYNGQQSEQQAAQDIRRLLGGRPEADRGSRCRRTGRRRPATLCRAADRRVTPAPQLSTALPPRPAGPIRRHANAVRHPEPEPRYRPRRGHRPTRPHPCLARRGAREHHRRVRADPRSRCAILVVAPSPTAARRARPACRSPTAVSPSGSSAI